jgi:trigger factor
MAANVEVVSKLERRMTVTVPMKPIEEEIHRRIQQLIRTAKLPGFRPGKVPQKIVEQQYGAQVRDEALASAIERSFGESVEENKLRVAGFPNIEHKPFKEADAKFEYVATFEVFPEVEMGDIKKVKIERPVIELKDADVEKTIEVLQKQRGTYSPVKRAAKMGDRVTIQLSASIDGEEVESTGDKSIDLVLGEGGRVAEFDDNLVGLQADTDKSFKIKYKKDHQVPELAGKTVSYQVTVKQVAELVLPKVDAEFAKGLGVEDGDVKKMKAEIKASLQQEVERRVRAKLKDQVFNALVENAKFDLPKALLQSETERLLQIAKQNLIRRGVDVNTVGLEHAVFEPQAKQTVTLRLVLSELVNSHQLHAKPEQIKAMVETFAQSYQDPAEVVTWYYADVKRLDEPTALATEENVVDWVLASAKVSDKKVDFDELMRGDNA